MSATYEYSSKKVLLADGGDDDDAEEEEDAKRTRPRLRLPKSRTDDDIPSMEITNRALGSSCIEV